MRGPRVRTVPTAEGVPIHVELASAGSRLAATALDLFVMNWVGVLLAVLVLVSGTRRAGALAAAVLMAAFFFVRCFYFPFFELRWRGQTPGKRAVRIRVVDRAGRALGARAVVARNLLRELELFLPLTVIAAPQTLAGDFPPWAGLLAGAWVLGFAALPLVHPDGLRAGDLVAGTMVVDAPRRALLDDLAARGSGGLRFTPEQLDVYGAYELQTLEGVLRHEDAPGSEEAMALVAARIRARIAWTSDGAEPTPLAFLQAFYAAQRARLEQRLLLGDRRERKRAS